MRAPRPAPLSPPFRAELEQLEQRLLRAALLDFGVFLYGNDAPSITKRSTTGSQTHPSSPYTHDNRSSNSHSSGSTAAPRPHRTLILDGRYWKRVKSFENLTAYKARDHIVDKSAFVTAALAASQHGRALPHLTPVAVVGSIAGSLSDVLYGLLAPSTPDLLLRSSYMGQDESSASVLAEMDHPTEDEPFRSSGVHWVVRGGSAKKTYPTEFIVLEATGMVDDHVGFHLRCSVPWSSDDALEGFQRIPRGWMASVALFREVGDGRVVDVCARTVLSGDLASKASSSADARATAALALSAIGEAARCGQQKKLVWMILDRIRSRGDGGVSTGEHRTARLGGHIPPAPRTDMSRCGACDKKFGALHSVGTCAMCALQMCSRCRITRPLRAVVRASVADVVGEDVEARPVVLCKQCLGAAAALDARTAAETEARNFGPDPEDVGGVPTDNAEDEDEDEEIELFGWERESSGHHRDSVGRPSAVSDAVRTSTMDRQDADDDEDVGTWTPSISGAEQRPRVVLFAPTVASGRRLSHSMSSSVDRSSESTAAATTSFSSSMLGPVSSSSSWPLGASPSVSDASSAWSDGEVDEEIDTAAYYNHHPPHLEDEPSAVLPPYQNTSQQDLWRTMAALRVAAESTYQLTKQIASQSAAGAKPHPQSSLSRPQDQTPY